MGMYLLIIYEYPQVYYKVLHFQSLAAYSVIHFDNLEKLDSDLYNTNQVAE